MGDLSRENVRLGFYFADLIFVLCQSTAKTAKIGSLENFRLYGILYSGKFSHGRGWLVTVKKKKEPQKFKTTCGPNTDKTR